MISKLKYIYSDLDCTNFEYNLALFILTDFAFKSVREIATKKKTEIYKSSSAHLNEKKTTHAANFSSSNNITLIK